jgi:hypothetical protein
VSADPMLRLQAADPVREPELVLPPLGELEAGWTASSAKPSSGSPSPAPSSARAARRRPHRAWRGGGIASISLAALVAAGAASATLTVVTGDPLGRVESVAVAPSNGSEHLARVSAVDPDGGPRWTVRIGRAEAGLVCLNVGQVHGGRLGIRGLDGVFRTDAVGDGDQCAVAPTGDTVLANARTFVGKTAAGDTSVVYGIAGPGVRRVIVRYPDGAHARLRLDRDGTFVVARRGDLTRSSPSLMTSPSRDGRGYVVRTVEFGDVQAAIRRRGTRGVQERPLDPTEPVR